MDTITTDQMIAGLLLGWFVLWAMVEAYKIGGE